MKTISNILKLSLLSVLFVSLFSCDDDDNTITPIPLRSIADQVIASPNFESLEAALVKAELVATLQGTGPFTVFAPNDDAFTTFLDGGSLDDLSKEDLDPILKYHVVAGASVSSGDLEDGMEVNTLNGKFTVRFNSTGLPSLIDANGKEVKLIQVNVPASNGVIHVIDNVLEPEKEDQKTIAQIVTDSDDFDLLEQALTDTNLAATFAGAGTFTVFAPTDTAFEALLEELDVAYEDINTEVLAAVLKMHVLDTEVASSAITAGDITTLNGEKFSIATGPVAITDPNGRISTVTTADVEASNGIIHIIDKVILPTVSKEYALEEKDIDGISGTATFALDVTDGGTTITLDLEGTPDGASHPSHIHMNSAEETGPIVVTLQNVDGTSGKSTTKVTKFNDDAGGAAVTFGELLKYDGYINVHKSADELNVLAAQGNIGSNVSNDDDDNDND